MKKIKNKWKKTQPREYTSPAETLLSLMEEQANKQTNSSDKSGIEDTIRLTLGWILNLQMKRMFRQAMLENLKTHSTECLINPEMLVFEKRGQRFITLYLCTIYALYYIDSTYHSYTIYTNAVYSSINKHALVQKP